MEEQLNIILSKLSDCPDYKKVIGGIISDSLQYNYSILDINIAMTEFIKYDTQALVLYLTGNILYEVKDENKYLKETFEFIKYLKTRYSTPLRKKYFEEQNPFGIQGLAFNAMDKSTHQNISVKRNDGTSLKLVCTTQEILYLVNSLNSLLNKSLESGIYNLDSNMINEFIRISNINLVKFNQLLGK